jgi:hypothetical protein
MIAELAMFARYARQLPRFLRAPLDTASARQLLLDHMRNRTGSLLSLLDRGVFANPASPYRRLLSAAGVSRESLHALVREHGVEEALHRLRDAGVFVSIDEFKGKRPIRRSGLDFLAKPEDFDNPLADISFEGRTGGSRGPSRRLLLDLGLLTHDAAAHRVFHESFGLVNRPMVVWRPVPPDNSGIKKLLMQAKLGRGLDRWFTQSPVRWDREHWRFAMFTWYTILVGRMMGCHMPAPVHNRLDDAVVVARWLAAAKDRGSPAYLDGAVSVAVRTCVAARENNLDIAGTMVRTGGEPLTGAKAGLIRSCGVRVACHFAMSEAGPMAMACSNPGDAPDDVHVLQSKMAVIPEARNPDGLTRLLVTTLNSTSPKLLLNVDTGDSAVVVDRRCGCLFDELGFHRHLHTIRSFEKLTSEGVQFLGTDLLRLVEETLPGTFGGAPTDYQIMEADQAGLPCLSIVAHPRLGPIDEDRLLAVVHSALGTGSVGNRLMTDVLEQAGSFRVLRQPPYVTRAGKTLALHVLPKQ